MDEFLDILLDCLKDSAIVFAISFVIYLILSFIEIKVTNLFKKHEKASPLIGAASGLIPQCGISVVASDLYIKDHITMGTLVAVFFSCSDEALPILLSDSTKWYYVFILLTIKFVLGFIVGYLVDLFIKRKINKNFLDVNEEHTGCCHHHIDDAKENKWKTHLVHPLLHSLKIFAYVLAINILFSLLIHYVIKEENLSAFLSSNKYLSPLVAVVIGLIPNCVSSVLLTNLFINGLIPFGGMLSGLCVNAGLGLIYLLKDKSKIKDAIKIIIILIGASLITGYITLFVMQLLNI